jgi:hypothetical protein
MTLVSKVLNGFLQAAGKERIFSFRNSTHYNSRSFEDLIYCDWATRQVAASLKKRVLGHIQKAHRCISLFTESVNFLPGKGFP